MSQNAIQCLWDILQATIGILWRSNLSISINQYVHVLLLPVLRSRTGRLSYQLVTRKYYQVFNFFCLTGKFDFLFHHSLYLTPTFILFSWLTTMLFCLLRDLGKRVVPWIQHDNFIGAFVIWWILVSALTGLWKVVLSVTVLLVSPLGRVKIIDAKD